MNLMHFSRRTVLKNTLALGTIPLMPWIRLHAKAPSSCLYLQCKSEFDIPFRSGLRAVTACETQSLLAEELLALDQLQKRFTQWRGRRVVSCMDHGTYAIFQELARDCNAQLLMMGRHAWEQTSAGLQSRHLLLSTQSQAHFTLRLSQQLASLPGTFHVQNNILGAALSSNISALPKSLHYQQLSSQSSRISRDHPSTPISYIDPTQFAQVLGCSLGASVSSSTSLAPQQELVISHTPIIGSGSLVTWIMQF